MQAKSTVSSRESLVDTVHSTQHTVHRRTTRRWRVPISWLLLWRCGGSRAWRVVVVPPPTPSLRYSDYCMYSAVCFLSFVIYLRCLKVNKFLSCCCVEICNIKNCILRLFFLYDTISVNSIYVHMYVHSYIHIMNAHINTYKHTYEYMACQMTFIGTERYVCSICLPAHAYIHIFTYM